MKESAKNNSYGNESISSLKGADRVRKRPAVIFGSDGLEGCEHAVFEILSNSIDEAREGHGSIITVTRYTDKSIEVEDFGRGCPVNWNPVEKRYNWELVFCELYAGGKYNNISGDVPLTTTTWKNATTGSLSTASFTQAVSTTLPMIPTNTLSVSTVSAHVLPSTHQNTWTSRYGATVSNTICTLRRARSSVNSAKRSSRVAAPAR